LDPFTFQIIRHRLFRIVEEAVITLKQVSGSATTNEGHDLMVSLYRADGGLLMGGVGFLHHITSAAEACKAIIRRFAGAIDPGDVFLLNDPYTAALHTSDVYLIAPIHHADVLVAWCACFVHVNDIGAMNPGGFSPDSRDIYTEGFSSPGLKLVRRGEIRRDVLDTLLNMVRAPDMVALDIRSLIACTNVARERMLALIERYGAGPVDDVGRTLIDRSEELFRARLAELPDGTWQARQYLDVNGATYRVVLAMTKRGDSLALDFTGSSEQSEYGVNCTYWAAWGALMAPLYPLLCHDITWNEGIIRPVEMIAPEGTIVNCTRPAPISIATVGAVEAVNNVSLACISKLLSASEAYAEESTAVWHGSHLTNYLFGTNQHGRSFIGSTTEAFGGAGGARQFADGVDVGGEIPNPISRIANVETNEARYPIRYLFRRRMPDSGGPGRWRGGTGGEYAYVLHDAPEGEIGFVLSGKGIEYPMGQGINGGYPGSPARALLIEGGSAAATLDGIAGAERPISWGVFHIRHGETLYIRWNGGGGYGDPLEREPERVRDDVLQATVSPAAARDIYGVKLDEAGAVDAAATKQRRDEIRALRRAAEAAG
jgi:N-methylhydantoinase B